MKQFFPHTNKFNHTAFCRLLLAYILVAGFALSSSAHWIRKADGLRKRGECASAVYQGKVYIFGGFGEHPNLDSTNEVYNPVTTVTLTATPAGGQQFTGWSGDATGSTHPLSVTMTANKTITATFAPVSSGPLVSNLTTTSSRSYLLDQLAVGVREYTDRTYTVTSVPSYLNNEVLIRTPNDDKTNTSSNILSFDLSETAMVYVAYDPRATALPGWMSGWQKSLDKIGVSDKVGNMDLYYKSFSAGKVTLGGNMASPAVGAQTGYFVVIPAPAQTIQYSLTVSASGSGTVTKNPDQANYAAGTTVTLTATPASGQTFTGWSGDASGTTNPLTVTMNANKSITATFAPSSTTYTLTANVSGSGTVTKNPNQSTYNAGSTVTLTATPASGQQFTGWSGDATGSTNPLSVTMTANKTITATFAPVSSGPLVSNLTTTSSRSYLLDQLVVGVREYTDRTYTVTSVPSFLNNEVLIRTPNDDKTNTSSNILSFDLSKTATVYVAYDPRATALPGWMNGWQKSPDKIGVSDKVGNMDLYYKSFNAGAVTLGGNMASPAVGALTGYFVVIPNGKRMIFDPTSQAVTIQQGNSTSLLDYISTSDNKVVNAQLFALDNDGNLPTWISVNGKILDGLNYTTGSEITFTFDATNLSLGEYVAKVYAKATGYNSDTLTFSVTVESGAPLLSYEINFQDSVTIVPTGYLRDYGQAFGQRISANQGTGNVYGWIKRSDKTPLDLTKNTRNRNTPPDVKLATFIHMQANDVAPTPMTAIEGIWEIQLANGNYDVTVSVGEGQYTNSSHTINVEGVNAITNFIPTTSVKFKAATVTVNVSDGSLTIDAIGGTNTKLDYIQIFPASGSRPSVVAVSPDNGATQVSENTSISTSILNLPNAGIDNSTINPNNVYLTEESTGNIVLANVNGTGGGDAITLVPSSLLKLNTTYVFHITNGVKDLTGAPFISFTSTFTTGTGSSGAILNAKFDKIDLPNAAGRHSSLKIGPDGKLYALSIDGLIKRFTINSNGTLGTPDSLYVLQDAYGPRTPRLAIGLTFDPTSTAGNLIAYVTHSSFVFLSGPSWDGKLTRLSGNNLQTVQDILVNLPRSAKDHLTNSVAFGPDKALYFTQGSLSAMGKDDQTWGNRNESLLSGAVLRLDMTKLSTLPLNVKTSDGGGTYSPYSANAPLTIYGSGVRNAYDLLWHTNGSLYVPTNGSAAGGNTPASVSGTLRPDGTTYNGPVIPELINVQQTQKDFLFRVVKGGYYGHPNPLRGEYVMNGGNPTIYYDAAEVYPYPVGTMPDANYRGYAFDFQNNKSPNGVIEYRNGAFDGALKGKILVVRYSQNDDILTLTPGGANKDIISSIDGAYVEGFSGFMDPLDLTEDTLKGNIYVSEYGGDGKIILLRVRPTAPMTTFSPLADASMIMETVASEPVLDSLLAAGTPKAYPNPFHNKFSLEFPSAYKGKYQMKISDISGKTIDLGSVNLRPGGQRMEINLSNYNVVKGVYFLRVISAEGKAVVIKLLNY